MTPEERLQLRRDLFRDPFDDPEFLAELERRTADVEQGVNVITSEELYARLRAAGRSV